MDRRFTTCFLLWRKYRSDNHAFISKKNGENVCFSSDFSVIFQSDTGCSSRCDKNAVSVLFTSSRTAAEKWNVAILVFGNSCAMRRDDTAPGERRMQPPTRAAQVSHITPPIAALNRKFPFSTGLPHSTQNDLRRIDARGVGKRRHRRQKQREKLPLRVLLRVEEHG